MSMYFYIESHRDLFSIRGAVLISGNPADESGYTGYNRFSC
jgi:hypothetical protein